jgi:ABC-type taurine transport system substrate-binding protein
MTLFTKRSIQAGLAVAILSAVGPAMAAGKQVTIGYQLMVNPWKVAIVNKAFERATGYDIKWVQFSSGAQAARGLASGGVQMIQKITQLNGVKPKDAPKVLANYRFVIAKQQLSRRWLKGGAGRSMAISAKFLKQRGENQPRVARL